VNVARSSRLPKRPNHHARWIRKPLVRSAKWQRTVLGSSPSLGGAKSPRLPRGDFAPSLAMSGCDMPTLSDGTATRSHSRPAVRAGGYCALSRSVESELLAQAISLSPNVGIWKRQGVNVGLFSRGKQRQHASAGQIIPPHLIERLAEVGQAQFGTPHTYVDVSGFYLPGFEAAGFPTEGPAWDAFVDQFVAELNSGADRQGGWANAGAFHVAKDFVKSEDWTRPNLVALMDRGLRFLVGAGVGGEVIPNFAYERYSELRRNQG
jgi:hypothetical protein